MTLGALRTNPSAASGLENTLTMQFSSERVYAAMSALRSGGLGERTLIAQETRAPFRSTRYRLFVWSGCGSVLPARSFRRRSGRWTTDCRPPARGRSWAGRGRRGAGRAGWRPAATGQVGVGADLEEADHLVAQQDDESGRRGQTKQTGQPRPATPTARTRTRGPTGGQIRHEQSIDAD